MHTGATLGRVIQDKKRLNLYAAPGIAVREMDTAGSGKTFTAVIGDEIKVTIFTIQCMYSQLSGKERDEEADEHSGYEGLRNAMRRI